MGWIYKNDATNANRYILGEMGESPFVCFGINPSYAEPGDLDPTIRQVKKLSMANGKDGWIMFNVYPQRSTDPKELSQTVDQQQADQNLKIIEEYLSCHPNSEIYAAWGNNIEIRSYLKECLKKIDISIQRHKCTWRVIGGFSQSGNPWHPRYLFIQHHKNTDLGLISKTVTFDVKSFYRF